MQQKKYLVVRSGAVIWNFQTSEGKKFKTKISFEI